MKKLAIITLLFATAAYAYSTAIISFNGGEFSPEMLLRSDFNKYNNACKTLENMFVLSQGPVTKRPGTKYISTVKDSNDFTRLVPFEYAKDDVYMLEFGDQYIRFYRNGGQILTGAGTEDLSALNHIVSHWMLNDNFGVIVEDSNGSHNGVLTTDATNVTETGILNGCFNLASTYAVEVNDHSDFSFTDNSNDSAFSIACWAYISESTYGTLVSKWRNLFSTREWMFRIDANRKLKLHLADTSSDLSSNRVAQWKLNEAAANTTVLDDTANNHDGTASSNTNTLTTTGLTNMTPCFNLDGSDAVVITNDSDQLSFGNATTDSNMSVSAWIYATGGGGIQSILAKYGSSGNEWIFCLLNDKLLIRYCDNSSAVYIGKITDDALSIGWHHVVATYNGGGNNSGVKLYVDNVLVDQSSSSSGTYTAMHNTAEKVVVGGYNGASPTGPYGDKIDNVILFNIELSTQDVDSLYNDGSGIEALSGVEVYSVSDDAVSEGWHFFTVSYSAPADETTAASGIIFYVDGNSVASTAHNNSNYTAMQNNTQKVRIGAINNYGGTAIIDIWPDKIDEVSIYSDVLTSSEITNLYNASTYEISTDITTSDLADMQFAQHDNVLYIVTGNDQPQKLTRLSHTDWTIEDYNNITGPFLNENKTDVNITPSGITGNITLTADSTTFREGHVDSLWKIGHSRAATSINGNFTGASSSSEIEISGDYDLNVTGDYTGAIKLERSEDSGNTWDAVYTRYDRSDSTSINEDYSDSEDEDGILYRITSTVSAGTAYYDLQIHDYTAYGVVRITAFSNSTEVSATVISDLNDVNATKQWSEGYWSDYRGWPETIVFHEQRLMFGGSDSYPQTIWTTKTASGEDDDYEDMTDGTLDDDALIYTLPGQNPIQWMLSQNYLIIGTTGGVGRWGSNSEDTPITPTQPTQFRKQAQNGSAFIPAVLAGDSILYVERGGQRVREFVYSLEKDGYTAPDMTILSEHITEDGITEVAYQNRPDSVLWCVLNDGNMACLTYERSHDVVGWTRLETDGNFESVAVIPGDDEDEVWTVVNRNINSHTRRYIEQFQPRDWGADQNDCWFVDSGLSYSGSPTKTFTGLGHLEGKTVSVLADGVALSNEDVNSGSVTIDSNGSNVIIGLPFTAILETMPFVVNAQDGLSAGKQSAISLVRLNLYKSIGGQFGSDSTNLEDIPYSENYDDVNTVSANLYTGWDILEFMKGGDRDSVIYFDHNEPTPFCIRGINADFTLDEQ